MAKPTLKFRLNGKAFSGKPETPTTTKIRAVLEALPDGDFLDTRTLAERSGVRFRTIRSDGYTMEQLDHFRVLVKAPRPVIWWGNLRSIRELKKHKELLA